jgi:hypothetical protein
MNRWSILSPRFPLARSFAMRTLLALAFLASAGLAQQGGLAGGRPVAVHTHVLALKGLPTDAVESMVSTAISSDGRIVAVSISDMGGDNSSPVWIHDVEAGKTQELSLQRDGKPWKLVGKAGLSPDGRFVAAACAPDNGPRPKWSPGAKLPAYEPPAPVIAVIEVASGAAEFVDLRALGCKAPLMFKDAPSLSNGAAELAIPTMPDFGSQVAHGWTMLWTRAGGSLRPLTLDEAYYSLNGARLSADGRCLLADSFSSGKTDPAGSFVIGVETGEHELVSVGTEGEPMRTSKPEDHDFDAGGRVIAFTARAADAPAHGAPSFTDVFVRHIAASSTECVSRTPAGAPANGASHDCALSGDGRYVAFVSEASNLLFTSDDAEPDVFVRDLAASWTGRVPVPEELAKKRSVLRPALSGDGRRAVFAVLQDKSQLHVLVADIGWPEPAQAAR